MMVNQPRRRSDVASLSLLIATGAMVAFGLTSDSLIEQFIAIFILVFWFPGVYVYI
jgi:hypothetical protein